MGGDPPRRCFYCLNDQVSIAICVDCRSRLEQAEARAKRAEEQAEAWRRSYWKLHNEKAREFKRSIRKD